MFSIQAAPDLGRADGAEKAERKSGLSFAAPVVEVPERTEGDGDLEHAGADCLTAVGVLRRANHLASVSEEGEE